MIKTLYKKNGGKVQQWSIEVDKHMYRSIEGFVNGAMTTSEWTVAQPKNLGRANATSPQEQAVKEAMAKVKLKIEKGYTESLDGETEERFEPMLAHKYEDHKDKIKYPCWVQPKLDGMRCPIKSDGARSRLGKPVYAVPHIVGALQGIFEAHNVILDGELYNHELRDDFNRLISLVKRQKPSVEDLKASRDNIQYHVYDCFFPDKPDLCFTERYTMIHEILKDVPYVRMVPTSMVDEKMLEYAYEKFLEGGYEGIMIRTDTPYVQKRTTGLLKRKEFVDGEYEITDIVEGIGNRSGMMGKFIMRTPSGESFEADASGLGGHEAYVEFLANKKEYIGKAATVKYQNLTPDRQVPRFGKVIAIRDYE